MESASRPQLILASSSPRRRELLATFGLTFDIQSSDVDEMFPEGTPPEAVVAMLAERKAKAVADRVQAADRPADGTSTCNTTADVPVGRTGTLVIGADTVVVLDGAILGKPADPPDAVRTLLQLQGRTHEVWTGVSVVAERVGRPYQVRTVAECTRVTFGSLSRTEIETYVNTGDPLDKAGSYGIQGLGALFVERIEGDYFNVVGLPLHRLAKLLREFGVDVWAQVGRERREGLVIEGRQPSEPFVR